MIVVSGAGGMLGQAVFSSLLRAGFQVRGIWFRTRSEIDPDRGELVQADLRSLDQARYALQGARCLVMCAVVSGGAAFLQGGLWPQLNANLPLLVNQLQAASESGVERIVFVGSATVYQDTTGPAVREEDLDLNRPPVHAHAGIGNVMRLGESLLKTLAQVHGLQTVVLRCANIYGPRDRFDPRFSNVLPALVRKAVERQDPFEVWGDPQVIRDLVYVDDVAFLVKILLERLYGGWNMSGFQVFNVGSGQGVSVGQLVQAVLEASGYQGARICYRQDRPVTLRKRVLNCDKVRAVLGWQAQTPLLEGVSNTLTWYEEHREQWKR